MKNKNKRNHDKGLFYILFIIIIIFYDRYLFKIINANYNTSLHNKCARILGVF